MKQLARGNVINGGRWLHAATEDADRVFPEEPLPPSFGLSHCQSINLAVCRVQTQCVPLSEAMGPVQRLLSPRRPASRCADREARPELSRAARRPPDGLPGMRLS
jgi:hypothetical protein